VTLAVVFPGQVFDADLMAQALQPFVGDPLVGELAELLGTDDWSSLDCIDASVAGPCTLVAGLLTARQQLDRTTVGAAAGHSFGEITALTYAGVLGDSDAMRIVARRGELSRLASRDRAGTMAAVVGLSEAEVDWDRRATIAKTGDVLEFAAMNDSQQNVVTGDDRAVHQVMDRAVEAGAVVSELSIPGAYHSPLMYPAVDELAGHLAAIAFRPLEIPVFSAIDGQVHLDPEDFRTLLPRGLVLPVRWREALSAMVAAGVTDIVDAGPGRVLRRLGRRHRKLKFRTLVANSVVPA
jgi:[acyl-carrier-protein] S-malonyltransferase